MQLKNDLSKDDDSRKQVHLLKRLSRAVKWSKQLQDLSSAVADSRTQIEAEAYATWMAGNEAMERMKWQDALANHLRSKTICEQLAKVSDFESEERCRELAAQMTATLRVCKYKVKSLDKKSIDDLITKHTTIEESLQKKFDILLQESKKQTSTSSMYTVTHHERKIPVSNMKIRKLLDMVKTKEDKLGSITDKGEKIEALTDIVKVYIQAHRSCQMDLDANMGAKLRTVSLDKKADYLKLLKSYLNSSKLTYKYERNQLQLEGLKSAYEAQGNVKKNRISELALVSAYEKLLQNVSEMKTFAEEANDEDELKKVAALRASYRAFRCYYLAVDKGRNENYMDSYVLYQHAAKLVTQAVKSADKTTMSDLTSLKQALQEKQLSSQANALLEKSRSEAKLNTKVQNLSVSSHGPVPLLDRLNEFHSKNDNHLSNIPLEFEATTGKPLFFDVAYHSLAFSTLDKRIEAEKSKSGGLLSSLGLW